MKYSGPYSIKSGSPGKERKEGKVVGIKEVGLKRKNSYKTVGTEEGGT